MHTQALPFGRPSASCRRAAILASISGPAIWIVTQPCAAIAITFCLVPLLLAIRGQKARHAFLLGWLAGTIGFTLIGLGTLDPLTNYYNLQPVAVIILASLLALSVGLPLALFAAFMARLDGAVGPTARVILGAAALAVIDTAAADCWLPSRTTQLAATLWPHPQWLQTAALFGTAGPTFVFAAVNIAIAELIGSSRAAGMTRRALPAAGVALMTVVAAVAYGAERQRAFASNSVHTPKIRCAEPYQAPALATGPANQRATLLLLPETYVDLSNSTHAAWLGNVIADRQPGNPELLLGVRRVLRGGMRQNSALLISDDALTWYNKRRLFPFTEHYPLGRFDPLGRRRAGFPGMQMGDGDQPLLRPANCAVATLICVEVMHPHLAADDVRRGARAIIALSNEEAVRSASLADRVVGQCVLRAIENRRPLVRTERTGRSLAVTADGDLCATAPDVQPQTTHDIRPARQGSLTFYSRTQPIQATITSLGAGIVALVCCLPVSRLARMRAAAPATPRRRPDDHHLFQIVEV